VVGPIKRQGYLAVEESQINHQGIRVAVTVPVSGATASHWV
jgi:hypothetical protein